MRPDGASMVLGPFAGTKGPRLPGRNPATQNITLRRGTGDKYVVESFVSRCGEVVRRQRLQEAGGTGGGRNSSTTDLTPNLKREDNVADLAELAVPNQFHLALVLEQQEAKLIRQGLVGFDIAKDFLLFLFGQSRHEGSLIFTVLQPGFMRRDRMENITFEFTGLRSFSRRSGGMRC